MSMWQLFQPRIVNYYFKSTQKNEIKKRCLKFLKIKFAYNWVLSDQMNMCEFQDHLHIFYCDNWSQNFKWLGNKSQYKFKIMLQKITKHSVGRTFYVTSRKQRSFFKMMLLAQTCLMDRTGIQICVPVPPAV